MSPNESVLRIESDRLAWRETGSEVVVLDLQGSVYFGLNPTAARLWKMLAGGATRAELVGRLVEEQRVDTVRAEGDVDQFLAVLRREHLLVAGAPA